MRYRLPDAICVGIVFVTRPYIAYFTLTCDRFPAHQSSIIAVFYYYSYYPNLFIAHNSSFQYKSKSAQHTKDLKHQTLQPICDASAVDGYQRNAGLNLNLSRERMRLLVLCAPKPKSLNANAEPMVREINVDARGFPSLQYA